MSASPTQIALFGSTGSIGASTLEVVRAHPERFSISILANRSRLDALMAQIREFKPALAILSAPKDEAEVSAAQTTLKGEGIATEIQIGIEALSLAAREGDYDTLLAAITGAAGLPSTLEAAKRGKRIALANKESLVMAGPILTELCRETGAELLPVDSEHSAVWQCLRGEDAGEVSKIILTASGGPFRTRPAADFAAITKAEALKHPTWKMGPKITIDSATLMNKALEIIEARWLFDCEADKLGALIHPQSIVHSMVEFIDGSMMAQLGVTTMELPIQLALGAPERLLNPKNALTLDQMRELTFEEIDSARFPLFPLGLQVAKAGGTAGAVFNAANEVAVEAFLNNQISFVGISALVAEVLEGAALSSAETIETVLAADAEARSSAKALLARFGN